jgi:FkbM family methyltransferase
MPILRHVRLDLLETAGLCLFSALVAWTIRSADVAEAIRQDAELQSLKARFGASKYSTGPEEWLIRDYFADRRGGTFLDVGAGDPRDDSNTYYLETALEWRGIAVDARADLADAYRNLRPRTAFYSFFVSSRSGEDATLYLTPFNTQLSSATRGVPASRGPTVSETVKTITVDDLLDHAGVTAIDFLSMDIELSEPAALAGFSINRFRPALACVEAHQEVRQQILDYFAAHNYVVVGRYLRADRANLYFAPRK